MLDLVWKLAITLLNPAVAPHVDAGRARHGPRPASGASGASCAAYGTAGSGSNAACTSIAAGQGSAANPAPGTARPGLCCSLQHGFLHQQHG